MQKQNLFSILIAVLLSVTNAHAQGSISPAGTRGLSGNVDTANLGSSLSLQQAVKIAIKNNLVVDQADLQMQSSRVSYNQSWSNLLPNISASGNQGLNFGRSLNSYDYTYVNQQVNSGSYGINGILTLFSGLQLQNTIKQNKYAYEAGKMDLEQQKYNITLNVLLAYLQILSSQDLLAIAMEQASVDQKQVDRLDAQNKEGALLLLSNLTDLKGQYAGDLVNIATAANNLEAAKVALFQLLNIPYKRDLEYDHEAFTLQLNDYQESPDSIYQTTLSYMPSVKSADLRIRSFQKALLATKGQYYPTLSFYGSVNTTYSSVATASTPTNNFTNDTTNGHVFVGATDYTVIAKNRVILNNGISFGDQFRNNKYTSVGLQLNIPILNYLRARNNVKQAKINLKNSEYNNTATRLGLQQNVELAYQNMIAAYKQYKSYIDQAAAYAESFRTTEIRFNEGVINSDVYVIAKNNTDRANANLSVAKYTYIFRTKVLDFYQGKLTW